MKLTLTLEADSVNVQALNMGRIVVDVDGVNLAELINNVAKTVIHSVWWMNLTDLSRLHATICCPYRHTLQYRTYHGNGQHLAVLAVASDE